MRAVSFYGMTQPSDEIARANIRVVSAIYAAHMLEELQLFDVAEKLVELWSSGVLPVGPRGGASVFDAYMRGSTRRLGARERVAVYARCFGVPGGDPAAEANRDFDKLWLRFVRAVSSYRRQQAIGDVLAERRSTSREAVRKAGRDLAANVSLHGFGAARTAASLQRDVAQAKRLIGTSAVRQAYGSRDVWQVVERVAVLDLRRIPDTIRYRTRARAAGIILCWLATRSEKLTSRATIMDTRALRRQRKSAAPLETPTDRDLMDACEQWLAVAGVPDQQIEQYAQPAVPEVRTAVNRLLKASAAFAALPPVERTKIARDTVKVASFMAQPQDISGECTHASAGERSWWPLQDVDFPAFVAALIHGVFGAIVDSSIQQMREYGELVKSVGKTVEAFAHDRITDDAARNWLCLQYPDALALTFVERKRGRLTFLATDSEASLGRISADLCMREPLTSLHDKQEVELVRQARRLIARSRQQLLATMVLLGIERSRS